MIGHMFKITDSPSTVRWYLVAIEDEQDATNAIRGVVGDSVDVDSRLMPPQVFEFLGLDAGSIQQWVLG